MEAILYGLIPVVCLLAFVAGVLMYVRLTGSGEKFRHVLSVKFREIVEKLEGPPPTSPVHCPNCNTSVAGGRFCPQCGGPLF